jgi:hypothetical protein
METLYLAVMGIVLYFVADWLVDLSERAAGRRFEYRTLLFFSILLGLAVVTFWVLQRLLASAVT